MMVCELSTTVPTQAPTGSSTQAPPGSSTQAPPGPSTQAPSGSSTQSTQPDPGVVAASTGGSSSSSGGVVAAVVIVVILALAAIAVLVHRRQTRRAAMLQDGLVFANPAYESMKPDSPLYVAPAGPYDDAVLGTTPETCYYTAESDHAYVSPGALTTTISPYTAGYSSAAVPGEETPNPFASGYDSIV